MTCYLPSLKFLPAESEHRSARQRHGSFQLETVPRCCRMMDHGWNTSCSMIREKSMVEGIFFLQIWSFLDQPIVCVTISKTQVSSIYELRSWIYQGFVDFSKHLHIFIRQFHHWFRFWLGLARWGLKSWDAATRNSRRCWKDNSSWRPLEILCLKKMGIPAAAIFRYKRSIGLKIERVKLNPPPKSMVSRCERVEMHWDFGENYDVGMGQSSFWSVLAQRGKHPPKESSATSLSIVEYDFIFFWLKMVVYSRGAFL